MKTRVILALSAIALIVAGCCKDKAPPESKIGIDNPENNPAVVAAAKEVMACDWEKAGFGAKCEALQAWRKNDVVKKGADSTLVNFLEDPDIKVQWLGAEALSRGGDTYMKDAALSAKIFDAMEKAAEPFLMDQLKTSAAKVDLNTTGLGARAMTMLETHENIAVRRAIAGSSILFHNRSYPGLFDLNMKLARSDIDSKVRIGAAGAFWIGTPQGKKEEVCKLWFNLANDADGDVAGPSAYHCAFWSNDGGCAGQWEGLLSLIEQKAKAGTVAHMMMASSPGYVYGQKKASDAIKKRALAVAKAIVQNKANSDSARSNNLSFIAKHDPAGKAFVKPYENDSSQLVRSTAKEFNK
ncbi:MAG: hypothetical protein FWD57_03620 [Polyangiaceae bacterium]|nr:hypothetical protein [Polyangiaceae bacterium]